jgi:hypothetical protein
MNAVQSAAFDAEIALARKLIATGELQAGFSHLERAHIIGQAFIAPHVISHWSMLGVELRRGRPGAVIGQVARMVLGMFGSAIGVVPVGNSGGTDVSMFKRMAIAPELQKLMDGAPGDPRA